MPALSLLPPGRPFRSAVLVAAALVAVPFLAAPLAAQPNPPAAPDRPARAYHFSPAGDDAAGDGSASAPWATTAKANTLDLGPGDTVLFEGGATFAGIVYLEAHDAGTAEAPVVVGSYGAGRATIDGGDGTAFFAYNAGGVEVRDLVFRGNGIGPNASSGIVFYADLAGDVKLEHVRVDNVEAHGFGKNGVEIGGGNGLAGYRDVRVTRVAAHGNRDGMLTYAERIGGLEDLYVGRSRFYDNPGVAGQSGNSGSGLIVSGVRGALVERNVAHGNGTANTGAEGPVGIWAYDADRVVIRHNESYGNRTGHTAAPGKIAGDGGGFDLDGGVTNSVLEYNYAHGNDGAGYLLAQYDGAPAYGGNVVRYNVSENDGRRNNYGGITFWAASGSNRVRDVRVYHNTVYVSAAGAARTPSAVRVENGHHTGITVRNNLLVAVDGAQLVSVPAPGGLRFEGNAYWAGGGAAAFRWGATTHGSLGAWRTATGQETAGGTAAGLYADPLLRAPGAGGPLADIAALGTAGAPAAYRLHANSPAASAALDLAALGVAPGPTDFYGTPLGSRTRAVGAHEPVRAAFSVVLDAGPGWYPVAVPVGGATVGGVLAPVWTQGFPGADTPDGDPSAYVYDEAAAGPADVGFVAVGGGSDALRVGAGLFAYVPADDDPAAPGVQGGFPKALAVEGPVGELPFAFAGLSHTDTGAAPDDGWSLLGNPLAGPLGWDPAGWTRADVSASVYVYDPGAAEYLTWNGSVGGLAGGAVPAGRAFWVQATGPAPALVAPASAGGAAGARLAGRPAGPAAIELRVTGRADGRERGASVHVAFGTPGAAAGPDAYDAYALAPLAAAYVAAGAVRPDGAVVSTNALPGMDEAAAALGDGRAFEVPLALDHAGLDRAGSGGTALTWRWSGAPGAGWAITLVDREAGREVALVPGAEYAFEGGAAPSASRTAGPTVGPARVTADAAPRPDGRFALRFARAGAVPVDGAPAETVVAAPAPNPTAGPVQLAVTLGEPSEVSVDVYDVLGRRVLAVGGGVRARGRHEVAVATDRLAPGTYVVRTRVLAAGGAVRAFVHRLSVAR